MISYIHIYDISDWRQDRNQYTRTAELVTKLEIIKKMYVTLFKVGVGTNVIERDAMRIVREKLAGPTGNGIVLQRQCEAQKTQEEVTPRDQECSPTQCWRDVKIVNKLTGLRRKIVSDQLRSARVKLREQMKSYSATHSRRETIDAWKEVRTTRNQVRHEEQPKHAKKINHLIGRAQKCDKHTMCRELDALWLKRTKVTTTRGPKQHQGDPREVTLTPGSQDSSMAHLDPWVSKAKKKTTSPKQHQGDPRQTTVQRDPREVILTPGSQDSNMAYLDPGVSQDERKTTSPKQHQDPDHDTEDFIEELLDKLLKERRSKKKERRQKKMAYQVEDEILGEDDDLTRETEEPRMMSEVEDKIGSESTGNIEPPIQVSSGPTTTREIFLTREQDLKQMERECEIVKSQAISFNEKLTRRICQNKVEGMENNVMEMKDDVKVFGNVKLSEDELELLQLGPNYMVVGQLKEEAMRTETTVTLTKIRWDKMKDGTEDMTNKEAEMENVDKSEEELMEEQTLAEAIDRETRDILSEDGRVMDLRKRRATDMRSNRKVIMPPPSKPLIEAELNTRAAAWQNELNKFKTNSCDTEGNQKQTNLSRSQSLCLKSLARKVSKLEVIILEADKGKTFVVVDEPTYLAMAQDHIAMDPVVTPEEIKESQTILSSLGKSLANMVGLGSSHSRKNYIRCFDNSGSYAEDIPNLKLLAKVHKSPTPSGHPQSRPVVSAAMGMSSRTGDLISDILEPMVSTCLPRQEDLSTEEVVSQLEDAAKEIRENKLRDTMVSSLDVRALYPSLDVEASSEGVAKFVRESKIEIEGIDWREVQVYLASSLDPHVQKREKIKHLLPARMWSKGNKPGPKTGELRQRVQDTKNPVSRPKVSKWVPTDPDRDLSETDKRLLFSIVLKVATREVFRHHVYMFAGVPRRQARGGPIGLRLTSVIARIIMDQWMLGFLFAVTNAGLKVLAAAKYVDDVNLVTSMLELGTRWVNGSFITREDWKLEDMRSGRSREDVTVEAVRSAADSILVFLEFTSDIPE